MCAGSPPSPPDYKGAAQTQGSAELQSTVAGRYLNQPNEYTPLGSRTWTQTGFNTVPGANGLPPVKVPQFTSRVDLTPQGQAIFDQQMAQSLGMARLGNQSMSQAQSSLSQPLDQGSITALQDKAYNTITSRLDPQWSAATTAEETKLRNQGLVPGGEAYANAMRTFNQGKNDAYQQANLAALNYGPQLLQEQTALREMPLNELNALRTGSQVTMPSFGSTGLANVGTPNYQAVAGQMGQYNTALYNAEVAQQNAMTQGLAGLGAAGILAYAAPALLT